MLMGDIKDYFVIPVAFSRTNAPVTVKAIIPIQPIARCFPDTPSAEMSINTAIAATNNAMPCQILCFGELQFIGDIKRKFAFNARYSRFVLRIVVASITSRAD
jgi:hypothetical protein